MKTKVSLRGFVAVSAAVLLALCAFIIYSVVPDISLNSAGLWVFLLIALVVAAVVITKFFNERRRLMLGVWVVLGLYLLAMLIFAMVGVPA